MKYLDLDKEQRDYIKSKYKYLGVSNNLTRFMIYKTDNICSSGVYILKRAEVVLYVGRSKNIFKRIYSHALKNEIPFDRFEYINIDMGELQEFESNLITELSPIYNKNNNYKYNESIVKFFEKIEPNLPVIEFNWRKTESNTYC